MMSEQNFESLSPIEKETNYEDFLEVRLINIPKKLSGILHFVLDENYTIWIAGKPYRHLDIINKNGIDRSTNLTEGYAEFDDQGNAKYISFCYDPPDSFFKDSKKELGKFQNAIRNVIRKNLNKPQ